MSNFILKTILFYSLMIYSLASSNEREIEITANSMEWKKKDSRFNPIPSEHHGIVEAPNLGLKFCRGHYVARMDADDYMHIDRLQKQVAILDDFPDVSVVTCLVEMFSHEKTYLDLVTNWLETLNPHYSTGDYCNSTYPDIYSQSEN